MTNDNDGEIVDDDEIRELIAKHADEHDVPVSVLERIYQEERAVVGMERRGSIYKDVDQILKDHVDKKLESERETEE